MSSFNHPYRADVFNTKTTPREADETRVRIDETGQNRNSEVFSKNNTLNQNVNQRRNRFNVNIYKYPLDIETAPDRQHYILFEIFERTKSKTTFQNFKTTAPEVTIDPVTGGKTTNFGSGSKISETDLSSDKLIQAGVGIGTGKVLGGASILSDIFDKNITAGSVAKSAVKAVVGTAISIGLIDAAQAEGFLQGMETNIINDAIILHIQDRPATNYRVNYQDSELGALGGIAAGQSFTELSQILPNLNEVAQFGISQLIGLAGGPSGQPSRLFQFGTKQITNPFREQFFESIDFRTFNFRHTFMPRSKKEAQVVKDIITLFKYHMSPELSAQNLFFIYPSEFRLTYMYRQQENLYFDKISRCVLEDLNVEYGGDIFSTFETGQPVEVNMAMRFKELDLITKKDIAEQGF